MTWKNFRLVIHLSRPFFLFGAALVYALGVGIARYLGATIDSGVYLLGQAWVTSLQLATHYLNEYFDAAADADNPNRTIFSGGSGALGPDGLPREVALWAGITALAATTSFTVLLMRVNNWPPELWLVMALIFLGAFFYSVPPVRLVSSGYGELTTSIVVANLVPAFAFLLQTEPLHRLVPMTTFPLTLLHLAMMLAFELPDFMNDLRYDKRTLMVRLGWERGMQLHNLLILLASVLLGISMLFGLSPAIGLPAMLFLPLGLFQIWLMLRIAAGAKPNWNILGLMAILVFGTATYLLAFGFWTR